VTESFPGGLAVPLELRLVELELQLAELELRLADLELQLAELELRLAELRLAELELRLAELRLAELELRLAADGDPGDAGAVTIPCQLAAMPREQLLTGLMRQLAAMPREQLIDFLINQLRSALPPGTQTRGSAGPRLHLIQIPQVRPPGSGT
jgi:hypothetical protein